MLQLRPYQSDAVEALFDYWSEEPGNPLLDLATGCGKSLVLSDVTKRLITDWPDMRVLVATHVKELIEQSYLELLGIWPSAPAGIYSAGVGRRDTRAQILFVGIQSVHNKAEEISGKRTVGDKAVYDRPVDVLMVDEAHLIPQNANTMYGRFIAALREINPDMKIVGLTATPFRLDSGRLDEGDDRLFDKVIFTYGIGDGIREGYLAPLSSKPTAAGFDLRGVGRLGGDYKQNALQKAVDKDDINAAVVDEIISKGSDRRSWLIFGSGVEHAIHLRDALRERGIVAETVTGSTPPDERRRILEGFKNYKIQAVTNNSVLTTGFNHKGVDLIGFCRPTLSAALYLQMAGRGTRPLYAANMPVDTVEERLAAIAAGPKPNCLVLDFAGLVRRHGPVDMVEPKKPGKGEGDCPIKLCPTCEEICHASIRTCPACGHEFEFDATPKISTKADTAPILSTEEPAWLAVSGVTFRKHEKAGKPPSVRVDYLVGLNVEKEWLCPGHSGFPKSKSDRWWRIHKGLTPFPSSADEFLDRADELVATSEIQIRKNGKYYDVVGYKVSEKDGVDEKAVVPTNIDPSEKRRLLSVLGSDWQL